MQIREESDAIKERAFQNYKRLTQEQMPAVRRPVRQCCNYDHGACIAPDDGAGCVCVADCTFDGSAQRTCGAWVIRKRIRIQGALQSV